jgi:hypothetical protein
MQPSEAETISSEIFEVAVNAALPVEERKVQAIKLAVTFLKRVGHEPAFVEVEMVTTVRQLLNGYIGNAAMDDNATMILLEARDVLPLR